MLAVEGGGALEEDLLRVETAIKSNFKRTRGCIAAADPDCALALLKDYQWVSKVCDTMVQDLVTEKDPDITPGDAVSLGLYIRWLKRINAHLRNITTAMVNPFHRIGFEPKETTTNG